MQEVSVNDYDRRLNLAVKILVSQLPKFDINKDDDATLEEIVKLCRNAVWVADQLIEQESKW